MTDDGNRYEWVMGQPLGRPVRSVGMTRAVRTVVRAGRDAPRWQRGIMLRLLLGWSVLPMHRRKVRDWGQR